MLLVIVNKDFCVIIVCQQTSYEVSVLLFLSIVTSDVYYK